MRRARDEVSPSARTSRQRVDGREPRLQCENGVLRSLTLTNFKAHSHFRADFGPHVNFIVGSNGTGKSAILAGVIQCLGGNPNKHSSNAGGKTAAQGLIQVHHPRPALPAARPASGQPARPPLTTASRPLTAAGGVRGAGRQGPRTPRTRAV